nr:retrotransposon protein, putative, Ty3-gypsy subclass [Tanacetum cinerariifolium]
MVGSDIDVYTTRFHELPRLVPHMVITERQRVNRYIRSLTPEIKPHVTSTEPATIQGSVKDNVNMLVNIRSVQKETSIILGRAFGLGVAEAPQDLNIVMGTFSLKDHFAIVLFDFGADYSFISTKFLSLINMKPSVIILGYEIEIASGVKVETNKIIQGCRLEIEGKANVVADALIRKERLKPIRARAMSMTIHSSIKARILKAQSKASKDVSVYGNLRTLIMNEAHATRNPQDYFNNQRFQNGNRRTSQWISNKLSRTSSGHDLILVIVDRLTKLAHFLAIHEDYKIERLARLYINKILARHGMPVSIIYDRDSYFTSTFWQSLQKALGTKLDLSTAYHPETDGQTEQFSYNNSYHSSVICAPFEALYGRRCQMPIAWAERYVDHRRKPLQLSVSDKVLLKVSPRKGVVHFIKISMLSPRYVGPYEIVKRVSPVAYRLRLPQEFVGVHDTFHVSNLRKCLVDVNSYLPLEEVKIDDKLHFVEEPMEIIDCEVKKLKKRRIPIVKVCWNSQRGPAFTWERQDEMKRKYPQLFAHYDLGLATKISRRNSL